MFNKDLLIILACPMCKEDVSKKEMFLVCQKCNLAFPILEDTVPDMILGDAWELEKARKQKFVHDLKL